jgi:hypothetical protein
MRWIGVAAIKSNKNPTSGNDSPNTPEVSESAIARMKVGELRRELQGRGVKGTADLKKPELVKKLIKLEIRESKSSRSKTNKPTSVVPARPGKKSAPAATTKLRAAAIGRSTAKKPASAAVKLPTTKKLLFVQTDLPSSSNEIPAPLEVSESQGAGPRGKSNSRKRTGKATAITR